METLKTLLEKKALTAGTQLIWHRRSKNKTEVATLNIDGTITTADGSIHKSLSGAARFLNDGKPIDGWLTWKVSETGKSLANIRENLSIG